MISKEELLKQKTKRVIDMEKLEQLIDDKLKYIKPDTIINEEVVIKEIPKWCSDEVIQAVLDKYLKDGGYSEIKYKIRKSGYSFDEGEYLDITLKL